MTLGKKIMATRLGLGLTLKELASRVRKEDGEAISIQFLNDIEHDRRKPSPHVAEDIAKALKLDPLYIKALADQPISNRPASSYPEDRLQRAIKAYRQQLGE